MKLEEHNRHVQLHFPRFALFVVEGQFEVL